MDGRCNVSHIAITGAAAVHWILFSPSAATGHNSSNQQLLLFRRLFELLHSGRESIWCDRLLINVQRGLH